MSEYEFVLNSQLTEFGKRHALSDRELELVYLLTIGEASTDAIATKLGVSAFTVSNHLKRIYGRTSTSSKPELISRLTDQLLQNFVKQRFVLRSHRVVLFGVQNPDLERKLHQVHLNVVERPKSKDTSIDLAICDSEGPWRQQLMELKRSPHHIILLNHRERKPDVDITEVLSPGTHHDEIVFYALYHLLDQTYERSRFHRVTSQSSARLNKSYSVKDISLGGLFLMVPKQDDLLKTEVGSELKFGLEIDKVMHSLHGTIAWSRFDHRLHRPSGLGIRFGKLESESQRVIKDYVIKRRMNLLLRGSP